MTQTRVGLGMQPPQGLIYVAASVFWNFTFTFPQYFKFAVNYESYNILDTKGGVDI
jgi:hypothetical protein